MNKSDFISDVVALDLGKSGVKVAETLEININNEWWFQFTRPHGARLI